MKIGYLTYNLDPKNGWGRYSSELVNGMKARGHEVVVLKEIEDGLEGQVILKRRLQMLSCIPEVRKFLADCDIIHALDGYPYGVIAYLANLKLKKPLIISAQGTYAVAALYGPGKILLSKAYRSAAKVVAISHFTKSEILKKVPNLSIEIINHGINLPKFKQEREYTEQEFILGVGALKERKGFHVSVEAFKSIAEEFPNLNYIIVGSADLGYAQDLKRQVKEYGLEKRIEFLSGISDERLRKLYRQARLFILTSINDGHHFEGFGLVFLEAAASGLPVIGTFGNGIEDAVWNNKNGVLVPQNDIMATAGAIKAILKEKDLANRMSSNSYIWAEEHDIKNILDSYENLYASICPV